MKAMFDDSMNIDIPIKNLGGNILPFFPMRIYLHYFIKKINNISAFSISIIILLFVFEIIQLVTKRGSFDIDDFILNMLGAIIGFRIWQTKFIKKLVN